MTLLPFSIRRQYSHTVLTNQQKKAAAQAQQKGSRPGPPGPGPGGPPPPSRNSQRSSNQGRPQQPQQQLFVANQDSDEHDADFDGGRQPSSSQSSQPAGSSGQVQKKPKYSQRQYGRFDAYHDPNAESDNGMYHYFFVVNILCFNDNLYMYILNMWSHVGILCLWISNCFPIKDFL